MPERNALFFAVELQNLDADLIADLQRFGGMRDAAVGDVADVQQSVDAAQIDERAVVGEILDDALNDCAFVQVVERVLAA